MNSSDLVWLNKVKKKIREFSNEFGTVYSKTDRALSAYFEIGCFLALVQFYEENRFSGVPQNLDADNSFRYLTTPNGNPENFSYMEMSCDDEVIEIRQQVRIKSHVGEYIYFTPDIVVIPKDEEILNIKDADYASGKRRFFFVPSERIIAAHECKSLVPFHELLVSFLGTLIAGHYWYESCDIYKLINEDGKHLAPALFVGGSARALHLKMVDGLMAAYPMNIILGLHAGNFNLLGQDSRVKRLNNPII